MKLAVNSGVTVGITPSLYVVKQFGSTSLLINFICRGFYNIGGGHLVLRTTPVTQLKALTLVDRGEVQKIVGVIHVAGSVPTAVS